MHKSVLIVDDKPEIAKIVHLYLNSLYELTYYESPPQAIEWLQKGNMPDAIISDLNMPEMNGEDFLIYLRSSDQYKDIPILILTSVESDTDRKRLLDEGANDFILKPFNPEELKARIKVLIK